MATSGNLRQFRDFPFQQRAGIWLTVCLGQDCRCQRTIKLLETKAAPMIKEVAQILVRTL
jgi:hypothetical protein